jgi:hypothetical protein
MSGGPASTGESPDAEALARAGWRDEDLTWEQIQEAAAEALAAGKWDEATWYWETGLALAREAFQDDDPRLATSLANRAVSVRREGRAEPAGKLFGQALSVWQRCGPWLEALAPERRARSSLFHLRLERKHPGGYDRHSLARYQALAEEGRAATRALMDGTKTAHGGLARWRRKRPAGYTDGRKLLAAVALLAKPSA